MKHRNRSLHAARGAILGATLLAGCTGDLGPTDLEVGPAPLRRLTRFEYTNAVNDLLGDVGDPGIALPRDGEQLGFDNFASTQTTSRTEIEKYQLAAEALARIAVDRAGELAACAEGVSERACGHAFVARFLERAYRRPPTTDETSRMRALFDGVHAEDGFAEGVGMVVEAALQAPQFLYRAEVDGTTTGDVTTLTPHELATRLSFLLWGSIPDRKLLAAAARGDLDDVDGLGAEAERMLGDPRARAQIRHFHEQWLGLGTVTTLTKDFATYPAYNGELRTLWREETLAFAEHVIFDGDATLRSLLVGNYTMANRDLARFYGLEAPEGRELVPVVTDPARRSGLLTQASLLATNAHENRTSPVLRGKLVLERFLCVRMPPPPPGAVASEPIEGGASQRDRAAARQADPACEGCHDRLDPIGLAFEHYDGIGQWRDDDDGLPIDAAGEVSGVGGATIAFDGATGLAEALASSDAVSDCVVTQWFRYASGRAEQDADAYTLLALRERFRRSGGDVRDLLLGIARSEAFRRRPRSAR